MYSKSLRLGKDMEGVYKEYEEVRRNKE